MLADRYRLSHRLGEGGLGQVWSAVHLVTGRRVAIKRLLIVGDEDDDESGSNQARARFILEAQAACAVEHPNVVEILDFVEPGDEPPLLVMELLQGETLASKLAREHALEINEAANLILPVVSAVGAAHSRGIIHRDLKPANIFLSERGTEHRVVKVLDFGIAKWVAQRPAGAGLRTQTGSTLGTPCYMAPEQAIGERLITHAVDIWSLGIILYESLTGARPLEGENPAQMVVRLLNTGIMPIERVVPTLPADVAKLVGRMLYRDPTGRPTDLREVFDVLRGYASVSAPTFAAPALEALGGSEDPPDATRASTPAVAWVPRTQPETLANQQSPVASSPAPSLKTGRRRVRVAAAGLAILAALLMASSVLRKSVAAAPPSERRDPAAAPVLTKDHVVPPPWIPEPPTQGPSAPVESVTPASDARTIPTSASPPATKPAVRRTATTPRPSATPPAASVGAATSAFGSPTGASCEHSRDCASRLCVAFVCE